MQFLLYVVKLNSKFSSKVLEEAKVILSFVVCILLGPSYMVSGTRDGNSIERLYVKT